MAAYGGWSYRLLGLPAVAVAACVHPAAAASVAILHALVVSQFAAPVHFNALVVGALVGMLTAVQATAAATIWAAVTAALISGAWVAGISLQWAVPSAAVIAAAPAAALTFTAEGFIRTPRKLKQSPSPGRRAQGHVVRPTTDTTSLFV